MNRELCRGWFIIMLRLIAVKERLGFCKPLQSMASSHSSIPSVQPPRTVSRSVQSCWRASLRRREFW